MEKGGNVPCVLNAANEIAVAAFLKDEIGFLAMSDLIEKTMDTVDFIAQPSIEDYIKTDELTREIARNFLKK